MPTGRIGIFQLKIHPEKFKMNEEVESLQNAPDCKCNFHYSSKYEIVIRECETPRNRVKMESSFSTNMPVFRVQYMKLKSMQNPPNSCDKNDNKMILMNGSPE